MLSYRHGFHAGNHADVLKHGVLMQVLAYMQQKDKPFLYVDTHAGAGLYDLQGEWARKTGEFENGIVKIWQDASLPAELQSYIQLIHKLNPGNKLQQYPGSPWLAHAVLRRMDKARLFELHSNEFTVLQENFAGDKHFKLEQRDGFKALAAVLPPASRRAVVLIDPSYEIKTDYQIVVEAVKAAYKRFANGVYLIWYPVINRKTVDRLERELTNSGMRNILLFELAVMADSEESGMTASGMIVVNPPWQLEQAMQNVLPWLHRKLSVDKASAYRISRLVAE